jgi:hypothetical protein
MTAASATADVRDFVMDAFPDAVAAGLDPDGDGPEDRRNPRICEMQRWWILFHSMK